MFLKAITSTLISSQPIGRKFMEFFRHCTVVGGRSIQTHLPCVQNRLIARKAAYLHAAQSVSSWPHAWRNGSVSGAFGFSAITCPFCLAGQYFILLIHTYVVKYICGYVRIIFVAVKNTSSWMTLIHLTAELVFWSVHIYFTK
jgi:hypothetical protein